MMRFLARRNRHLLILWGLAVFAAGLYFGTMIKCAVNGGCPVTASELLGGAR